MSSIDFISFLVACIRLFWEGIDLKVVGTMYAKGQKISCDIFPAILHLVSPGAFHEEAITVQMVFVAEAENNCASSASLLHRADEQ